MTDSTSATPARTGWVPLALAVGVGTFMVLAKVHKAVLDADSVWRAPVLLGEDLAFAGAVILGTAAMLGLCRPSWVRGIVAILVTLLLAALGTVAVFEHGFYLVTGILLDAYIVGNTAVQLEAVAEVIASEIPPWVWVALAFPFAFALALPLFHQRAPVRWLARRIEAQRTRHTAAVVCVAVLLGVLLHALGTSGERLAANPFVGFARDGITMARAGLYVVGPIAESIPPPLTIRATQSTRRHNVVLVVLESMAAGRTSLTDPSLRTTPFLESLARKGRLVETGYGVVPHTSKALVSVHCGVFPYFSPATLEANPGHLPGPCLAQLLADQGYATAFFQPAEEHYERRAELVAAFGFETFRGKESLVAEGFDESSYFGWEDDAMLEPAVRWAQEQEPPFFLSLLTLTSHHPYSVPVGFPRTKYSPTPELDDYLNTIAYTDRFVSRLYGRLEAAGLIEDTVFVVVGDHGEGFGEHGRRQHDAVIYEEGLRVPMIVVGPDTGTPGTPIEGLRQIIDVTPTILDALGYQLGGEIPGRSLLSTPGHEVLYFDCYFYGYCSALREGDRKYVYHYGRRPDEVYDLASDPAERRELIRLGESSAARMKGAAARMRRVKTETNAVYRALGRSRRKTLVHRTRPADVGTEVGAVLAGQVRVVGWEMTPQRIEAGGHAVITVVYEALETPDPQWSLFLHLDGPSFQNLDHIPAEGTYPVSDWEAGEFILDRYVLVTRPDTPVGRYRLRVGLWNSDRSRTERRAEVTLADGTAPIDRRVTLGTLDIIPRAIDVDRFVLSRAPPDARLDVRFGEAITLLDTAIDKVRIKGGLKTTVTYTFRAEATPPDDWRMVVWLDGPTPRRLPHVPVRGAYPLSMWEPGQVVIDRHEIITHTRDRLGEYRVLLGIERGPLGAPVRVEATGPGVVLDEGRVEAARYMLVR